MSRRRHHAAVSRIEIDEALDPSSRHGWHPLGFAGKSGRLPRGVGEPRYVKNVVPRSEGQARLIDAVDASDITIALGPAGTGKTYLAAAKAVEALVDGKVSKIVLSRPAVDAGERLGFLPGDMVEKVAPYMRPIYDALHDRLSARQVRAYIDDGTIEISPIAFMRGRSINGAFVVVDEVQNLTRGQLKMVVTRLGFGSKMVLTGDPNQVDIDEGDSGLCELVGRIEGRLPSVSVVKLDERDVVRHPVVKALIPLLAA